MLRKVQIGSSTFDGVAAQGVEESADPKMTSNESQSGHTMSHLAFNLKPLPVMVAAVSR
jgi:hypothetical protein